MATETTYKDKGSSPTTFRSAGNLKNSWGKFKVVWDRYEIITELDKDCDKVRIAHSITAIGNNAHDIYIFA